MLSRTHGCSVHPQMVSAVGFPLSSFPRELSLQSILVFHYCGNGDSHRSPDPQELPPDGVRGLDLTRSSELRAGVSLGGFGFPAGEMKVSVRAEALSAALPSLSCDLTVQRPVTAPRCHSGSTCTPGECPHALAQGIPPPWSRPRVVPKSFQPTAALHWQGKAWSPGAVSRPVGQGGETLIKGGTDHEEFRGIKQPGPGHGLGAAGTPTLSPTREDTFSSSFKHALVSRLCTG